VRYQQLSSGNQTLAGTDLTEQRPRAWYALLPSAAGLRQLLGKARYKDLPERVLLRIREQQETGEILICCIQLGVVSVFATLYAIAPKTFEDYDSFAPVPWVLGAYFVFSLLRLHLAIQRRLPEWLVYCSVVIDMLLLMGLIWSFHKQYQQPASFYLKAPTLLYVFIFIALRTLRFEVRYVLLGGVVAALGWLGMVCYVVFSDPSDNMITRDYVHYMTSNSILLGAEFDKVISILTVTVILAIAIARARALMVQAVVEEVAAHDLSRFVPEQVARHVTSAAEEVKAGQGETREATVLFTDIEGFTTIGEPLSPAQLIATLNEYFQVVVEPIRRHGGVINQFQGDAILASFNLPDALPNHADEAMVAALEIHQALEAHTFNGDLKLRSRIGINTGVVVGGIIGTGDQLSYTVHGDDVNLAARLEQLNKEYGTRIMVSERTRDLAGPERYAFREAGEVRVRGRSTSTRIFVVD